jgi:hypothetical protein
VAQYTTMAYGGVEVQLHSFVIPALEEEEWIAPNTPEMESLHSTNKRLVNRRSALDISEKGRYLSCAGIRTLGCPARSLVTIPTTRCH